MLETSIKFEQDFVALISAGASGIGKVVAETLLSMGARVHICDISAEAIESFLAKNPDASATLCDVADFKQVEAVYRDLNDKYGKLDLLVNNAGIAGPTAKVEDIDVDNWQQTIDVDLNAQFYFTKLAVPMLKQNGSGSIINVSSNAAFFGFPLRSPYTASKWALIGLTKTWAMELGPDNIRVNAVCPGSVKGPRIDGVIERDAKERGATAEEVRHIYQLQSSMRLFVGPEDVANMIAFLASPLGACISGQAIGLDGHTESLSNNI
ncbi:SDR family oxidoreductase [Thalassotalea agarivorans]|uniref:NAD(P)-dependent dehydrogenase, short-chain alcohol dehydrogenase family n=1 Tax=Thalassotalea agarivorans TaxID=349064 RepID=A0A1I0DN92_THASX|nr:SDR family oxidoreductase [Thalassotalea agarivorans]SET33814.1 NAD(P)-dependent dehydrogenase, short-chain alcohol dehydrogenase family [Thalassotalea agarivorans]